MEYAMVLIDGSQCEKESARKCSEPEKVIPQTIILT